MKMLALMVLGSLLAPQAIGPRVDELTSRVDFLEKSVIVEQLEIEKITDVLVDDSTAFKVISNELDEIEARQKSTEEMIAALDARLAALEKMPKKSSPKLGVDYEARR